MGELLLKLLFYISLIAILWHNIFYYVFLLLFNPKGKETVMEFNNESLPFVSYIVPVHNEEAIIKEKILNILNLDYPKDRLEIVITSDASNDKTEEIVKSFQEHYENINLIRNGKRKGKVNAQNEAVKASKGEILAFSDVNTFWEKEALINLVSELNKERVGLACGKINYVEDFNSEVAYSENLYWRLENKIKELESDFYSLSAINGGIYAMRKLDYIFLDPIYSHDLCFPSILATNGKRSIFVENALALEKSGSSIKSELKRKLRMFSIVYNFMFRNIGLFLNPLKTNIKFFIVFFSHRTLRYLLPFLHIILLLSSMLLMSKGLIFIFVFYFQVLFLLLSIFGFALKRKSNILYFFFYYLFFLYSMVAGFLLFALGKTKSFWESSIETRGGIS